MMLIGMVRAGKRLLAIGRSIGVIERKHDSRWWRGGAGQTVLDEGGGETGEVFAV